MKQILYIKNMVCPRCKNMVNALMQKLNLQVSNIELGEVEILANQNIDLSKLPS